jgi:excisionase family DNA binding protein
LAQAPDALASQPSQRGEDSPKAFAAPLLHGPPMPATSPAPAGATLRVVDGARGRLLTVRAVAARLGVSAASVYGLCGSGVLPHVRIGNAIRIEPGELEAFKARQGRRGTRSRVAQDREA